MDYDNLENGKLIHLVITAGDSETDEPRINTIITLEPHLTTQNLLPIPTLLEMRLSRTISYITNLRNILQIPSDQLDLSRQLHMLPSSFRSMRQTHTALRQNTTDPNAQIALVMEQMADVMELTSPWLKQVAENRLNHEIMENEQLSIVLRAARILQIMSLIYCFLGSAMDLSESPTNQEQPRSKKQKLNHHC
ncbi:hypothetical protein K501DRAFT_285625 [Backusella circina FSU 941]|nr:hypothetical protein K501DRAFT_285625 [Backusella circina FSU 941]